MIGCGSTRSWRPSSAKDPEGHERRREADRSAALAGKSTLNRLELGKVGDDAESDYHRIVADLDAMEDLLIDLFLDVHEPPSPEIILAMDPTDSPVHGEQWGRHFQTHYDEYCFLPRYVFCGDFLLAARLRPGDVGETVSASQAAQAASDAEALERQVAEAESLARMAAKRAASQAAAEPQEQAAAVAQASAGRGRGEQARAARAVAGQLAESAKQARFTARQTERSAAKRKNSLWPKRSGVGSADEKCGLGDRSLRSLE